MKEVVVNDPPRRIAGLEFCALSPQDMLKQAEIEVSSRNLYDISKGRTPHEHGPLDSRLGVSSNFQECTTCHGKLANCQGHFGLIKLALPCFHVGYFKSIISIMQSVCKVCLHLKKEKKNF